MDAFQQAGTMVHLDSFGIVVAGIDLHYAVEISVELLCPAFRSKAARRANPGD